MIVTSNLTDLRRFSPRRFHMRYKHKAKTIRGRTQLKRTFLQENERHWMSNSPNKENAIAFCRSYNHMGYLDENMLKKHRCLEKQCPMLSRYEDREYWVKRAIKKEVKKLHKNGGGYICINGRKYNSDNIDMLYKCCKRIKEETNHVPEIRYQRIEA